MSQRAAEINAPRLVDLLHRRQVPVSAIDAAYCLGIEGKRETKRRRIREAAAEARENGHRICADLEDGYWLARSHDEWEAWLAHQRRGARYRFARMSRAERAAVDRGNRQGLLFPDHGRRSRGTEWATR